MTISREESPTSISMISSFPGASSLTRESSELDDDKTIPPINLNNSEYRLSNRRFRQLSPLEHKPSTNSLLTVENKPEGFVNHAYSSDSFYNQLTPTNSVPITSSTTSNSLQSLPSVSTSPPSTNGSLPRHTIRENIKHMWSVTMELMKNTRFVCIIIANLFEGILIKGKSSRLCCSKKILISIIN